MISNIDDTLDHILSLTRYFAADDTSAAILAILIDLGFSVQCDGFIHLRLAILRKYDRPQLRCQDIYEEVSREYGGLVTTLQIEQAIRSSIDSAWSSGTEAQWDLLFPPGKNGRRKRPANHEFISRLACLLELWSSCRSAEHDPDPE